MWVFHSKAASLEASHVEPTQEIEAMVDTGASYSWVSRARLEPLGVKPVRRMQFRTVEGKTIERDLVPVFVAADGFTGGDNVVLAESGDREVIGASHAREPRVDG